MDFNFKNKTVLITGATRGIGKQMAHDFDTCGAHLILTGTDKHQIIKLNYEHKLNARYLCVDFMDVISLNMFIEEISPMKIDICVNNAGINKRSEFSNIGWDTWRDIMDVNFDAPFYVSQKVAESMKKHRRGKIINIASIFGVVGRDNRVAYIASKSGLIGLTRAMAIDLAPYNILVNSVSAGIVDTDMTKKMLSEKEAEEMKKKIPLGRFATTKEISNAVLFLTSEMNTYITGQNLIVDGGYVSI